MVTLMGVFPDSSAPSAVADGLSFAPPSKAPLAIVDLGSNSARVVVVEHPIPGVIEVVAEERLDLRLATELDESSRLSERGIATTIDAVGEFAAFAREAGADSIRVVATAAIRSARNRTELLARAHAELGLAIEVLDGSEEAEYAATGALHGLPIRSGVIADIGGGSTEVARVIAGRIVGAWSFPLGSLSASAEWLTEDPPARKQLKGMRRMVADTLATSAPSGLAEVRSWSPPGAARERSPASPSGRPPIPSRAPTATPSIATPLATWAPSSPATARSSAPPSMACAPAAPTPSSAAPSSSRR